MKTVEPRDWSHVDPWWETYEDAGSVVRATDSASPLVGADPEPSWSDLDQWWDVYSATGHDTAEALAERLERSNATWRTSDGPFDTDPLDADLTGRRLDRGPLQPNKELQWSRWLAQLLRPSGELLSLLFGVGDGDAPETVTREDILAKETGGFRRPDVLVFHGDRGVSIEVKLGDDNYAKTAETAALVEEHHPEREWHHALLLPKRKHDRLASVVDARVIDGPERRLMWDDPGPVDVVSWRDVTAAVRSVLRRGAVVDDHWAANAYLFCAVAEQRIMGFQPLPAVARLAAPTDVVDATRPLALAGTLAEQLTYLGEVGEP